MPRAGSTLLLNLLGQNPRFHVSPTSGLLELVYATRNMFSDQTEFRAQNSEEMQTRLKNALHGLVRGWYHDSQVAFDKSRGWLQYFELLSSFWPDPKIIVPIRDIRDTVASFERLWRQNPLSHHPADNPSQNPDFQYVDGRMRHWITVGAPIGLSLARIYDAFARGHAPELLFVRYEDLCRNPLGELHRVYEFTGEEWFDDHDPDNIPQITREDDSLFGPLGDHQIRSRVEPNPKTWSDVLPHHCGEVITNTFAWFYQTFYPPSATQPPQPHP